MSDPLQIALIGCGAHSRDHHAVSLARYVKQHSEEVRLAAACDLDEIKAKDFCCEYGFSRAYTDVDAMLEAEHLDACIAVMPAHLNVAMAEKLLRQGMPCVIEKPLGRSLEEARRLVRVASETGTPHMVSINRRFNPYLNRAVALAQEEGGSLSLVRASMVRHGRKRPDFAWSTGIHAVDALRHIDGEIKVYDIRVIKDDSLSNAWYSMDGVFESGCRGELNILPTGGHHEECYDLFGEGLHVRVSIEGNHPSSIQCWKDDACRLNIVSPADEPYDVRVGAYDETVTFITALREGRAPRPTLADILPSQEICSEMVLS